MAMLEETLSFELKRVVILQICHNRQLFETTFLDKKDLDRVDSERKIFRDIGANGSIRLKNNDESNFSFDAFLGFSNKDLQPYMRQIKSCDSGEAYFLIDTHDV